MSLWNWLTSSASASHPTPSEPTATGSGGAAAASAGTAPAAARTSWPEPEVVVRQRSVDGLNSWQMEQVREIVREEIARLLPQVSPVGVPTEQADKPTRNGVSPRRIHRRVWEEPNTSQRGGGLA